VLPPDVPQFFLPARGTEVTYRPMLYCAAEVKFLDAKKGVDITKKLNVLAPITSDATPVSWEDAEETDVETGELEKTPVEGASYEELPPAAGKAKSYPIWQKDFVNWIFSNRKIDLFQSPSSGELSLPDESERDFRVRLQTVARERRDAEVEAMRQKYGPKLAALEEKIRRAENALAKEQQQKQSATLVNAISIGSSLLGALFGSRKVSTGIGKAATAARGVGRIQKEAQDVGIAEANLEALRQQYADLEATVKEQTDAIAAAANPATEKFEIVSVRPKKTGITARLCALTWVPEK
jgi:hypothetical protein